MSKKAKKFKQWNEDWEYAEDYDRKDGKRYNAKKESVKEQREQKNRQKHSFFDNDR